MTFVVAEPGRTSIKKTTASSSLLLALGPQHRPCSAVDIAPRHWHPNLLPGRVQIALTAARILTSST